MDILSIKWSKDSYNELVKYLYTVSDKDYKKFIDKIINTKYKTIGVRMPVIRDIAKRISKTNFKELFKYTSNSDVYEIILLEGLLYSYIKDTSELKMLLFNYSKRLDSWALTDTLSSSLKQVKKYKEDFLILIDDLIKEEYVFSKRLGYILLLNYYIEVEYIDTIFNYIINEKDDNYYVKMAIAWLLSFMYIKYPNDTYNFLKTSKLDDFIIKKTISKISDSYRVNKETKEKLKKDFLH